MNIHLIPVSTFPLDYDYCMLPGAPTHYQRFGFEKTSISGKHNERGSLSLSGRRTVGLVRYADELAGFST